MNFHPKTRGNHRLNKWSCITLSGTFYTVGVFGYIGIADFCVFLRDFAVLGSPVRPLLKCFITELRIGETSATSANILQLMKPWFSRCFSVTLHYPKVTCLEGILSVSISITSETISAESASQHFFHSSVDIESYTVLFVQKSLSKKAWQNSENEKFLAESVCSKQKVSDVHGAPVRIVLPVQRPEISKFGKTTSRWSQSKDKCRCPADQRTIKTKGI